MEIGMIFMKFKPCVVAESLKSCVNLTPLSMRKKHKSE